MNIYIVRIHSSYETYIRSTHATQKGALLEYCSHVADQLLEYEFEKEEVALLDEIIKYTKQDKTAVDTLNLYRDNLDELGDRVEMWPNIVTGTLLP
jgi:hypothetical protein